MTDAFVLGGVRTPFARYGSSLSHIRADELLGMTMKGACERVGVGLDQVEDIVAGCVNPAHEGMGDVGRWAALAAGFPDSVAGATINRFCGSSVSATINVAHAIKAGDLGVGIACGVESMSRSGWAYMKGDAPFAPRGPVILLDTMWAGAGGPPNPTLLARNAYIGMIETAQNVADRYKLTREEIDAFALRSQQHAKAARDSGRLAKEIMPVQISATKKIPARTFEHDEFIRDDTTAEQLAALPVQPGTTQMTAANSTPLTDGASAGSAMALSVCASAPVRALRWCWKTRRRPESACTRAVGPGEDFQVVPTGILEIHAAAAVIVVDLAGPAAPRVGPMLHASLTDASVDGVELVLGYQEGVVLRADVLALGHLRVVEADTVVEFDRQERTEFLGGWQAEQLGEEVGGFLAVLRGDDGVVERDCHTNSVNHCR